MQKSSVVAKNSTVLASSMRSFLIISGLAISVGVATSYFKPEYVQSLTKYLEANYDTQMHERELRLNGMSLLKKKRINEKLPLDRSNLWWRFNTQAIERDLLQINLVQQVEVRPCSTFSYSCFDIDVKERSPSLLVQLNNTYWLIGDDGGYMARAGSVKEDSKASLLRSKLKVPLVTGIADKKSAPEFEQTRVRHVLKSITSIKNSIDPELSHAHFHSNGELSVWFKDFDFEVVFDSHFSDMDRLSIEIDRLNKLLKRLKGRERAVEKIDLAFDRVAVVSLTDKAQALKDKLASESE